MQPKNISWKNCGKPQIMLYFREGKYYPKTPEDKEQFERVIQFKKNFPKEGLFWTYKGTKEFERSARNHLTQFIKHHASFLKRSEAKLRTEKPDVVVSKIMLDPIGMSGNPPMTFSQVLYHLRIFVKNAGFVTARRIGIELVLPSIVKFMPLTDDTPMHPTIDHKEFCKHIFSFETPIFVDQERPFPLLRLYIDPTMLLGSNRSDLNCLFVNDNIGWILFADDAPPKFGQDRLTALSKLNEHIEGFAEHVSRDIDLKRRAVAGHETVLDIRKMIS